MNSFVKLPSWCLCFFLCSCITDYEAKNIDEERNILVVEGIITSGETTITLSRSLYISDNQSFIENVSNALVYIECDDGAKMYAQKDSVTLYGRGERYIIQTDMLNMNNKYRLRIELEEYDTKNCIERNGVMTDCPTKIFEYGTDFAYPIATPEIESIFWTKNEKGHPIIINLSTQDPNNSVLYYYWSYREDWEIVSDLESTEDFPYPYICWGTTRNSDLLIGSAETTVFGKVTCPITSMLPTSRKIEILYRITVCQNAISKRAYDYFANIKKNTEQVGSIFTPAPSELRGNIFCITEPERPVIGYVDISNTTQKQMYISKSDDLHEFAERRWDCEPFSEDSLLLWNEGQIPRDFVPYEKISMPVGSYLLYVNSMCIDCTHFGTEVRPDNWPSTD